jgi:hypothetical protein
MSRARDLANLGGSADAGGLTGRNLIINGAMTVAQRGTVTGVTTAYGGPDRFQMSSGGSGEFTISQDTDVPSGQGFASSFKIDVTTEDSSLAAGDNAFWYQKIEGQNTQHIKKGTSNAESLTLQFWIKSSTTGTYIVELYDNDNTRHIAASYTVNTADTWEHKTVTFAGDTTGTIANDNTAGLHVGWWLAAGTTFNPVGGTLQTSWGAGDNAARAVGQVNAIDDTANNIYFTGVQLEVGSTATPFEHEDYGTTLRKCQRYYELLGHSVDAGVTAFSLMSLPFNGGTNNQWLDIPFMVEKRAAPTSIVTVNGYTVQTVTAIGFSTNGATLYHTSQIDFSKNGASSGDAVASVSAEL